MPYMVLSEHELDQLRKKKSIEGFEAVGHSSRVAKIEKAGQYQVKRAVTRFRVLDGIMETEHIDELEEVLGRLTLQYRVEEGGTFVDLEDLAPVSPSVTLDMVKVGDEYQACVTMDSVMEVMLMTGLATRGARSQSAQFMRCLVEHIGEHHEDWHRHEKGRTCDCSLAFGPDKSIGVQFWEFKSITPDSFMSFSKLTNQEMREVINRNYTDWSWMGHVQFGPKRISLLRTMADEMQRDLEADVEKPTDV